MAEIKIPHALPIHKPKEAPDAKIKDAAKMYEKYFLGEMMKAMRQTVAHTEEPSMAQNIYTEQLDKQYVENWGDRGGVGFADLIYNQVKERFFNQSPDTPRPHSLIPIDKGTLIKIDNTKQMGIPVVTPKTNAKDEVSFLYEWNKVRDPDQRDVENPFDGEVLQSFQAGDDRQILKLAHDNGLVSTINYLGHGRNLQPGDRLAAGQKIGTLGAQAQGLTWQLSRLEV
jgi:Rod binding domain-containing protein